MVEDSKESENDSDLDSQIVQVIANLELKDEEQKVSARSHNFIRMRNLHTPTGMFVVKNKSIQSL